MVANGVPSSKISIRSFGEECPAVPNATTEDEMQQRLSSSAQVRKYSQAIDRESAREMLTADGFILLTRTQPVRYAIERAERNGTSLGQEYFATEPFAAGLARAYADLGFVPGG